MRGLYQRSSSLLLSFSFCRKPTAFSFSNPIYYTGLRMFCHRRHLRSRFLAILLCTVCIKISSGKCSYNILAQSSAGIPLPVSLQNAHSENYGQSSEHRPNSPCYPVQHPRSQVYQGVDCRSRDQRKDNH